MSAEALDFDISDDYNQSKILVQEISIKALRVFITFRIKSLETSFGSGGFF